MLALAPFSEYRPAISWLSSPSTKYPEETYFSNHWKKVFQSLENRRRARPARGEE
jgi:hypothetical protein